MFLIVRGFEGISLPQGVRDLMQCVRVRERVCVVGEGVWVRVCVVDVWVRVCVVDVWVRVCVGLVCVVGVWVRVGVVGVWVRVCVVDVWVREREKENVFGAIS